MIQRGDSALRLNVRFHVLVLDGVYVRETESGALVFQALSAPTEQELAEVAKRTALRVKKVLARHGRSLDGTSEREDAEPSGEQLSLSALCAAAASGQGLFGERAGKPLLRVVDPKRARSSERVGESQGINVHAEVVVPARDRARLERLCRYVCRPPIAQNRLEEIPGGKTVLYRTIVAHWPAFRERAEEAGGLPKFVVQKFEAFSGCGRLEAGCLHLACRSCGHSQLVAFSCKKRAFCPSCCGRRMADSAVHLEQNVLLWCPFGTGSARCRGASAPSWGTTGRCARRSSTPSSASSVARSSTAPSACSRSVAWPTRTPGPSPPSREQTARSD